MRAPKYTDFTPSSSIASQIKQRVPRRNTKPEIRLRSALHRLGLRFRLHRADLPGRPDVIFPRGRVAVFVDGDFWHGRDWARRRLRLAAGANREYWLAKIESNMARDRRQTALLENAGWAVLRLWETDVLRDPERAASEVASRVKARVNELPHLPG